MVAGGFFVITLDEQILVSYFQRAYKEGWYGSIEAGESVSAEIAEEIKAHFTDRKDEYYEEGGQCPECRLKWLPGVLVVIPVVGCTCHCGHPPCSACVGNPLTCNCCGWDTSLV